MTDKWKTNFYHSEIYRVLWNLHGFYILHKVHIPLCSFDLFQVIPLLSHPNDEIVREVLAFLKAILFAGNRHVQQGLEYLQHTREDGLFTTMQGLLRNAAITHRERWVPKCTMIWAQAGFSTIAVCFIHSYVSSHGHAGRRSWTRWMSGWPMRKPWYTIQCT